MEITERNRLIYEDRLNGMTFDTISKKYSVSVARANQIYGHVKRSDNRKMKPRNVFEYLFPSDEDTRIRNCIKRKYWNRDDVTLGEILSLSDEELLEIRNFGESALKRFRERVNEVKNNDK